MSARRIGLAAAMMMMALAPVLSPAKAEKDARDERVSERIHSALPLYTFDWHQLWPRSFTGGDGFGCTSRVAFGDWRFRRDGDEAETEESWHRVTNYGVFHCAAILREARERNELDDARWDYGFFVLLGTAGKGAARRELWAVQRGTTPGSSYTLLARTPGDGLIKRFTMLQQRCPAGRRLMARGMDIWSTRYCAINSRRELTSLARRMLSLPPLGVIEWQEPVKAKPETPSGPPAGPAPR